MTDEVDYFALWAKTKKETGQVHALIYHLIDVGQTTLALWQQALTPKARDFFCRLLGLDEQSSGNLLAFWASLHDLGKAAPGFQRKYEPRKALLESMGFKFPQPSPQPAPHGWVTAWALENYLVKDLGYRPNAARKISRALGGHHGAFPKPAQLSLPSLQPSDKGDEVWDLARKNIVQNLAGIFHPPPAFTLPVEPAMQNAFLVEFSGLVSVADWIGSMVEFFPLTMLESPLQAYAFRAAQQAQQALVHSGWLTWQPDGRKIQFREMFPSIQKPNPIQETILDSFEAVSQPALLILESPTGSGKTEAALYLADCWLQTAKGKGLYVAMPTQATSNQMHERVEAFLHSRYPRERIQVHLAHGGALLSQEEEAGAPFDVADDEFNQSAGSISAQGWFLPRKRTLLAPFGVGTVDQALLSVLQTKHFFVRLFGLGQKVIVFDEVHAYDTYMNTLFERLLAWLRLVGTSVILLSATLPEATRQKLASAWLDKKIEALSPAGYPRLTFVSDGKIETTPLPAPANRELAVHWLDETPQSISQLLAQKLAEGGCAAVICNRVKRAQEVFRAIQAAGIVQDEHLVLFHARFPFAWRQEIEKRVLSWVSKTGRRPEKLVVVATQVIEQSLDLDFDFMISDLAPIDLLIQRAGRLHRHRQNDANRPPGLRSPMLAIGAKMGDAGLPDFGADQWVYELEVLLRTWLALKGRTSLTLPQETTQLIEAVYGGQLPPADAEFLAALEAARMEAQRRESQEILMAKQRMILPARDEDFLNQGNDGLEEEDPRVGAAFRALTRLAEPGVSLICLHNVAGTIRLEADNSAEEVNLNQVPDRKQARELLKRAVTVQRREVVNYFSRLGEHPAWKRSAALRYHYPVIFDSEGIYRMEGTHYFLFLSRETGIEIRKETI